MNLTIRKVEVADASALADVYNHYVTMTAITFEEQEVSAETMAERICHITAKFPWVVAEAAGAVVGYAYATEWRARSAYRYSVESTVYVSAAGRGHGTGTALYRELLAQLAAGGYHLVIAGITLPNEASVRLHERLGFMKVAHFHEVGRKFEQWLDVGYWQRQLS